MRLIERIKFVFTYDIDREFIVIDPESPHLSVRCTTYETALEVRAKFAESKPWYGKAKILVGVSK